MRYETKKNFHIINKIDNQGRNFKVTIFNQLNPTKNFANIFVNKNFLTSHKKSFLLNFGEGIICIPKKNCFKTSNPNYYNCSVNADFNYWTRDILNVTKKMMKGWTFLIRFKKALKKFCYGQRINASIDKITDPKLKALFSGSLQDRLDYIHSLEQDRKNQIMKYYKNNVSISENSIAENEILNSNYLAYNDLSNEELQRLSEPVSEEEAKKLLDELVNF